MAFPVNPIDDLVFVSPEVASSLIELPDPRKGLRGRVLAIGPNATDVKVNDMVHLSPGRAIEAVFDQKRVWVSRERELLAVEA